MICVSVFAAKNHLVPENILRNGVVFKKVGEEIVFFNNVLAESQWSTLGSPETPGAAGGLEFDSIE